MSNENEFVNVNSNLIIDHSPTTIEKFQELLVLLITTHEQSVSTKTDNHHTTKQDRGFEELFAANIAGRPDLFGDGKDRDVAGNSGANQDAPE